MNYIAHMCDDGQFQSVKEHSENTAVMSKSFAVEELQDICYTAGLLHDIGKYQNGFQKRIRGEAIRIEHSICGAKVAYNHYGNNPMGILISLCIAGHHGGIPDCGGHYDSEEAPTLFGRLKRECESYQAYEKDLSLPELNVNALNSLLLRHCKSKDELIESYAFLTRYCFSCLTDADSLDTMHATGIPAVTPLSSDYKRCLSIIEKKYKSFKCETNLQKARSYLQHQAFENVERDADIYLMGMPTGSGKTLASLKCALIRALKTGKKRIIYVIPYNSIIDQTADTLEELLGDAAHILRHQSTFSYEDKEDIDEDYRQAAIYGCENWDAEIIITTSVQFFESVYANRRGKLRKLHNMANSILIFDEAHLMPLTFLQPCLRAISCITKFLHSEAFFLTATMPDFPSLIRNYALQSSKIIDLIPDHKDFHYFQKNIYNDLGMVSDEALLQKAKQHAASLIVVNSRNAAKNLFGNCGGEKYHLSTYMTGMDREIVIKKIRERVAYLHRDYPDLVNVPEERKITVISTSLIEAGVDLDFSAAFREINGLDNLLQTGGRCNREGYLERGSVYIFEREGERKTQWIQQSVLRGIIDEYTEIDSPEAIREYYSRLFCAESDMITKNSLSAQCGSLDSIPFRTYSERMHLIDSGSISVMIPEDDVSHKLIEEGRHVGHLNSRKIQKYCCTVFQRELSDLITQHAVEEIGGVFILTNADYYDKDTGIRFEGRDKFF